MSERGKKYKNQTARENRQQDKVVASQNDEKTHRKKKNSGRRCGGWEGSGWRGCPEKVELTTPCDSCNRRFCSKQCHDSHKALCQLKKDKDKDGILRWAKGVYDGYVDAEGYIFEKWHPYHDFSTFKWDHRDLQEASEILRKREIAYFRGDTRAFWW